MRRFFTLLLVAFLIFSTGILVGKMEYPPFPFLRDYFQRWFLSHNFDEIPSNARINNVREQVSFHSKEELLQRQDALKKFIWAEFDTNKLLPRRIDHNIARDKWSHIHALKRVDRIIIPIEQGITSTALLFTPQKLNQQALIYHEGHKASCADRYELIEHFLQNGFTLICLDMPLTGLNAGKPLINTKRFGKIQLYDHDRLELADQPFRYFLDPVIALLNFLQAQNFARISMLGFSGGGWTTVLASAIDPRIKNSFSIAGSYPHYLRSQRKSEWGDFEQHYTPLYRIATYPELYIMATNGGRTHTQIINRYDPCCFGGIGYQSYAQQLQELANEIAHGKFDAREDPSHHKHQVSSKAIQMISKTLLSLP